MICRVSFIDLYLVFPRNVRIVFLTHTNTVILREPYFGTIKEPGLPVLGTHALVGTLSGVSTFDFSYNFAFKNSAQIQNFTSWHCRGFYRGFDRSFISNRLLSSIAIFSANLDTKSRIPNLAQL